MQARELAKLFDRVSAWTYPTGTTYEIVRDGRRLVLSLDGWSENAYQVEEDGKTLDSGLIPNPARLDPLVNAELEVVRTPQELMLVWRYWRTNGREDYEPTGKAFVVRLGPKPAVVGEVKWSG